MAHSRFHAKFHGRIHRPGSLCHWPGCGGPGEFRAPGLRAPGPDGPGDYRWFCLEHIREYNAGYDYFAGMTPEQIWAAQSPIAGWEGEARAFRPTAGIDQPPRWADFADPLEAIRARAQARGRAGAGAMPGAGGAGQTGQRFTPAEARALAVLGLDATASRRGLRLRYAELLHRFHPDRNGGDRAHEARLQQVVEAYQLLRKAAAFA